jgi:integrase
MVSSAALAKRPAAAIVAQAAGPKLPSYVSREQARAMINAAETTTHRLLLEALWQTGGRVREVLRLRPSDLVEAEGAIALTNLKQRRREQRRKLVYVNPDLLGALRALARDAGVPSTGYFFRSRWCTGPRWRAVAVSQWTGFPAWCRGQSGPPGCATERGAATARPCSHRLDQRLCQAGQSRAACHG